MAENEEKRKLVKELLEKYENEIMTPAKKIYEELSEYLLKKYGEEDPLIILTALSSISNDILLGLIKTHPNEKWDYITYYNILVEATLDAVNELLHKRG
jgi:translation initiation factor 2 alpha subunit (eIF-2alpha)